MMMTELAAAVAIAQAQSPADSTQPSFPPVRIRPWRGVASPPPGADTLDVHSILRARSAAIDSALRAETTEFDTLGLDSLVTTLDRGGAAAAASAAASAARAAGGPRKPVRLAWKPLALSTYDRVNGLRLGSGAAIDVGRWLTLDGAAARALSAGEWAWSADARAGDERAAVEAGWFDHTVPFGPNQGAYFTSLGALVAGQDRQEHLQRRAWHAGLALEPARRTRIGLRYFVHEDDSAPAVTDFHFAGGDTPIERASPAISPGTTRGVELRGSWRARHDRASVDVHGGVAGGSLRGAHEFAWQEASARVASPAWAGGVWELTAGAAHVAGSPPVQAVPFLGGDGNLRGFAPLEFGGDVRLALRAEYAWGYDLLARTRVPVVRSLRLQFIPFVDAGTTWGVEGGALGAAPLDGRWKSSVGLGIKRNIDYPGLGAVRLDVSRRTDGGPGGVGVWFRVMPFGIP
jgi:hypothetical protein